MTNFKKMFTREQCSGIAHHHVVLTWFVFQRRLSYFHRLN
jgi:hypothetical protein